MPGPRLPYYLGLPAWAFPGWRDRWFSDRPSPLASYARVFDTVEGNTTFYGIPDARTIAAWRDAVAGTGFRFCFKLPQTVTHARRPNRDDLAAFLAAIEPLENYLGPLLVQFPARIGPGELDHIGGLLDALPAGRPTVIEVRHPAFFDEPSRLDEVIDDYGCGRVMLDARAIHEGDRHHPEVLEALHEKPDLPVLPEAHNGVAFTRLVLHPDRLDNDRYIDEWAARMAGWIEDGVQCWMTIHCPNNLHCPELALGFHRALRKRAGASLPDLPPWPVPQQAGLL